VSSLAFSKDEKLMAAGTTEFFAANELSVFDTKKQEKVFTFHSDTIGFSKILFIDNSKLLIYSDNFGKTAYYILNINSGEFKSIPISGNGAAFKSSTNELYFLAENSLKKFNLRTNETSILHRFEEKQSEATLLELDEKEEKLILAGREIHLFDLEQSALLYTVPAKQFRYEAMLFDPFRDGLLMNGDDGAITHMDMQSNQIVSEKYFNGEVRDMIMDANGEYLITATADSVLSVHSWERGYEYSYSLSSNDFISLTTDPSGNFLAASVADSVYFFNLKTGEYLEGTDLGYPEYEKKIVYSPNGRDLCLIIQNVVALYDTELGDYKAVWQDTTGNIESYAFSEDGRFLAAAGYSDSLVIYDTKSLEKFYTYPIDGDYIGALAFMPESHHLLSGHRSGKIRRHVFENDMFRFEKAVEPHYSDVTKISFSKKDKIVFSAAQEGKIALSEADSLSRLAILTTFTDGTWAIIDEEKRYDAPNGGDIDHIHFVIGNEPVALSQLRERAYDPGLLQKILGYNSEPLLNVSGLDSVNLYPEFKLTVNSGKLRIEAVLRDRELGRVGFYINGVERSSDIKANFKRDSSDPKRFVAELDLLKFTSFLRTGENNKIGVIGYNADNYLSSRLITTDHLPMQRVGGDKSLFDQLITVPKLYALVVGTANYRGDELDLKYADSDAIRFADALSQTASGLFGEENVSITVLTTQGDDKPSKEAISQRFDELKSIVTTNDYLVIYFSGHGATYTENGGDYFYYLTQEMANSNIADPYVRANFTISSNEMADWISAIPVERNVLILDACFSGTAINDLLSVSKSTGSSNERAIQRMKHRLGTFIIAGSAPDQVSFESTKFKQSLLTYALLNGMRGEVLVEEQFIDVQSLFSYAVTKVQEYAASIGTFQIPKIAQSAGGSFYIGRLDSTVNITLDIVRSTIIRSEFRDSEQLDDILEVSSQIDNTLRSASMEHDALYDFSDVRKLEGAYYLRGEYSVDQENLVLTCILRKDKTEIDRITLSVPVNDRKQIESKILEFVYTRIQK
jgi:WD40 repeat protein